MQKETRPFVPWKLVDDFMTAVFVKLGVPEEDARLCSDVLLRSDRWGIESQYMVNNQSTRQNNASLWAGTVALS